MILGAPASVQFTPSFLRCMIQAAQGRFIPGNIVVVAKASNLFIHCMAICDMVPSINQASPLQVLALLWAVLSAPGDLTFSYSGQSESLVLITDKVKLFSGFKLWLPLSSVTDSCFIWFFYPGMWPPNITNLIATCQIVWWKACWNLDWIFWLSRQWSLTCWRHSVQWSNAAGPVLTNLWLVGYLNW